MHAVFWSSLTYSLISTKIYLLIWIILLSSSTGYYFLFDGQGAATSNILLWIKFFSILNYESLLSSWTSMYFLPEDDGVNLVYHRQAWIFALGKLALIMLDQFSLSMALHLIRNVNKALSVPRSRVSFFIIFRGAIDPTKALLQIARPGQGLE